MECLIGIKCDGFTLLAHDNSAGRSVLVMKQTQNKLYSLDSHLGMVVAGEPGDTAYFGEYIQKNIALYRLRNGYSLSAHAAASYTRHQLAQFLRRSPYMVNLLLGGWDPRAAASSLYFMDYLGTMAEVPFAAHGYGSYFVYGLLDRHHRPDMTEAEGVELLERCVREVQQRFMVNLPAFSYYVINENGFSERHTIIADPPKLDPTSGSEPVAMTT